MFQIGDQFDHFQIRAHLAQGGMSDIYRAYDFLSGREVVLKIPNRASIGDPAQYERFQRELEVMRTLDHPAIQKGVGSGQFDATPYLVTGLITGESMRALVERRAPMPAEEAVALIRKIADGLAHCHDNDIIHRDIKPENILITPDGDPVILDFGLALTRHAFRVTYANLTGAAGTPDYMAPEQIEGQRGDRRTDVYAVGTMLFELLAGRLPFEGRQPDGGHGPAPPGQRPPAGPPGQGHPRPPGGGRGPGHAARPRAALSRHARPGRATWTIRRASTCRSWTGCPRPPARRPSGVRRSSFRS